MAHCGPEDPSSPVDLVGVLFGGETEVVGLAE